METDHHFAEACTFRRDLLCASQFQMNHRHLTHRSFLELFQLWWKTAPPTRATMVALVRPNCKRCDQCDVFVHVSHSLICSHARLWQSNYWSVDCQKYGTMTTLPFGAPLCETPKCIPQNSSIYFPCSRVDLPTTHDSLPEFSQVAQFLKSIICNEIENSSFFQ